MKEYNILNNPDNLSDVTAIYRCIGQECTRTLVTYTQDRQASKHRRGLPRHILDAARVQRIRVIPTHCDEHGGVAYKEPEEYPVQDIGFEGGLNFHVFRAVQGFYPPEDVTVVRHMLAEAGVDPRVVDGRIV